MCLLPTAYSILVAYRVGKVLYIIEVRHLDVHHFVNEECRHLVNGVTAKCGCIGLLLFRYL